MSSPTIADAGLAVTRGEATTVRCTVTDLPAAGTAGWQVLGEFRVAPSPAAAFAAAPDPDSWPAVIQSTDFTVVTPGAGGGTAVVDVHFTSAQTLRLPGGLRAAVFAAWETGSDLQVVQPVWVDVRPQVR